MALPLEGDVMSEEDNEVMRNVGGGAGAATGFTVSSVLGGAAAGAVFGPPGMVIGALISGLFGGAVGKKIGRENPKSAIAAASVTMLVTGGAAGPAMAAGTVLMGGKGDKKDGGDSGGTDTSIFDGFDVS
jgi:hypothetical protein